MTERAKEQKREDKEIVNKTEETKEEIIQDIEKSGVPEKIAKQEEKLDEKASKEFEEEHKKWNSIAGVYDLDKSMKKLKEHLSRVLEKIVENKHVDIDFSFLF